MNKFTNPNTKEYQSIGRMIIDHHESNARGVECDKIAQQLGYEQANVLTVYSHLFPDFKLEKTFDEKVTDVPLIEDEAAGKPEDLNGHTHSDLLFEIEPIYKGTRL